MLFPLKLEHMANKDNRLWFDKDGNMWYGKTEENLQSAEGLELATGYKIPPKLYVADLKNAFLLGLMVGLEEGDNITEDELDMYIDKQGYKPDGK